MTRLSNYFHTIKHLRMLQIFYQCWYKLRSILWRIIGHHYKLHLLADIHPVIFTPWIEKRKSFENGTFNFLNLKYSCSETTDWDFSLHGKLWTYNLNYMDFLLQPSMEETKGKEFIEKFIEDYSRNKTGKEPYTISIRGINWIKFLSKYQITDSRIGQSLYAQYKILEDNMEYHIMGNHLLENGISLLFASFCYNNYKLFTKAKKIISRELSEQICKDGCHFEKSPMYHQIILERLLDAANLLKSNNLFAEQKHMYKLIVDKTSLMLGWLVKLSYNDGSIPLFNDSAMNIAPTTQQLIDYANTLGIQPQDVVIKECGYRIINKGCFQARVDVGNIGPDYIPGHGHADTFTFEVFLKEKPLVVDTGISTYEKCHQRLIERGTAAHNTVQVLNKDSSEVWDSFRVARRAYAEIIDESNQMITARHDGFKRFGIIHERQYYWDEKSITITDQIIGKKSLPAVARIHFHPSVDLLVNNQEIAFQGGTLKFENADIFSIKTFNYAPEFNNTIKSSVVEIGFNKRLITYFEFTSA